MKRTLAAIAALVVFVAGAALGELVDFPPRAHAYGIPVPGQGAANSSGYPGWGADIAVSVTNTTTTAGTGNLTAGLYVATCTVAVHVDQGATGVAATTSERLIPAFAPYPLKVLDNGDDFIAWIRDSADGSCILSKDVYE